MCAARGISIQMPFAVCFRASLTSTGETVLAGSVSNAELGGAGVDAQNPDVSSVICCRKHRNGLFPASACVKLSGFYSKYVLSYHAEKHN